MFQGIGRSTEAFSRGDGILGTTKGTHVNQQLTALTVSV